MPTMRGNVINNSASELIPCHRDPFPPRGKSTYLHHLFHPVCPSRWAEPSERDTCTDVHRNSGSRLRTWFPGNLSLQESGPFMEEVPYCLFVMPLSFFLFSNRESCGPVP